MSYDYYYKDINVTFTVPEGSTINKISIQEDYGYTFPTWPDGTKGMTYSPATPTNEVVLKMGHPGSYAYFYGITVEYTKVSGTVNAFPQVLASSYKARLTAMCLTPWQQQALWI